MGLTGIRLGARRVAAFRRNCNRRGRREACAYAHTGQPRHLGRWRTLDTHQRLARSTRADSRIIGKLHQRGSIRASPIEGSGAHRRGDRPDRRRALAGRERSPFTLIATAATLAAGVRNPMFDVLGSDVMWRRAITPGAGFSWGVPTPSCSNLPPSLMISAPRPAISR